MDIIENFKKVVFKNYATFTGRASRSEYWYFILASIVISMVLGMLEGILGIGRHTDESILANIYSLLVLVPTIAVAVRRIHDSNRSGWWVLLPLYNLYLVIIKGTEGDNRFGPDSVVKESSSATGATSSPAPEPVAEVKSDSTMN